MGFRALKYLYGPNMGMKKITGYLLLLTLAVSCLDDPDCYQLNNNVLILNYKILGGQNDQVPFIGIETPASDSVFNALTISGSARLPLNPTAEQMEFSIVDFYANHNLSFSYSRQIQFVSEECGERYYYSALNVLGHDYDSVRIVNSTPQPETSGNANIEIYRCPRTNLAGIQFKQIINSQVVADTVVLLNVDVGFSTPIFVPNDTIQTINVPLNPNAATTTILFTLKTPTGSVTKSVTVTYARITKELFERCGVQTLFTDLDVSATDFSDYTVLKDSIQDLPVMNLEVIQ